jgi:hypothetical protein
LASLFRGRDDRGTRGQGVRDTFSGKRGRWPAALLPTSHVAEGHFCETKPIRGGGPLVVCPQGHVAHHAWCVVRRRMHGAGRKTEYTALRRHYERAKQSQMSFDGQVGQSRLEFRLPAGPRVLRRSRLRSSSRRQRKGRPDCLARLKAGLRTEDPSTVTQVARRNSFGRSRTGADGGRFGTGEAAVAQVVAGQTVTSDG